MTKAERDCVRALLASAADYALGLSAELIVCRPWSSALFVGSRLKVAVRGDDDARLDEWLIALPDAELAWTGHFVASAEVIERSTNAATIEFLAVEG